MKEVFDMSNEKRSRKCYVIPGLRARVRAKTLFGLSSNPTAKEYPGLDIALLKRVYLYITGSIFMGVTEYSNWGRKGYSLMARRIFIGIDSSISE